MSKTIQTTVYHFEAGAGATTVDKEKGVIYGVSLITSGITAKGHDLEVDKKTLEQMLSCAEKKGKIPVKWNHKTGADAVSGYLKNFRIEGRKLVGDWHLLKSHERYAHALELASEMPECLGLSTSFRGDDEQVGTKKYARCTELVSADLVASPAANPDGFFEARVDSGGNDMADNQRTNGAADSSQENKEFSLADVMAAITKINERMTSFEEFQDNVIQAFNEPDDEDGEEEDGEEDGDDAGDEPAGTVQSRRREFSSGSEALQYLHEKLASIEDAKEQARIDRAFAVYDEKVENLIELNERLAMENAAMAEAIHEFSRKTGAVVEFSASPEGDGFTHTVMTADSTRRAPRTQFEARCRQFEAQGKDEHEAIRLAIKEDRGLYQRHLQEIGVMNTL